MTQYSAARFFASQRRTVGPGQVVAVVLLNRGEAKVGVLALRVDCPVQRHRAPSNGRRFDPALPRVMRSIRVARLCPQPFQQIPTDSPPTCIVQSVICIHRPEWK